MIISNIKKTYKRKVVLNDINISLNKGDFVILIGINGSGKSTLIKLLAGLLRTDKNKEIKLNDVAYLPEKLTLPKTLSVKDYLKYLECDNNVDLSYYVNYLEVPYKLIKELSKGNLQKLGLLYLISSKKEYLLLDEPTEGMDQNLKKKFIDILKNENQKGKTIIISSHQKKDYQRIKHREILIEGGNVIGEELNQDL